MNIASVSLFINGYLFDFQGHRRPLLLAAFVLIAASGHASKKPNVLFIAIDDLRPELGCYENSKVISPNIDRLAAEGVLFERAYCQLAVCGPSRLSIMTGRHLESLGVFGMSGSNIIDWRETRKGVTTLPEQFRKNGYYSLGIGKLFDYRLGRDEGYSWDMLTGNRTPHFANPENARKEKQRGIDRRSGKKNPQRRPAVESYDTADETYTDGNCTKLAIEFLNTRDESVPFFLAVGYVKPHLPFVAPKKYWDLYDRSEIDLPKDNHMPPSTASYAFSSYKEIFDYEVDAPITEDVVRELRHGYYACVSYVDAQVGKLVAALEEKGELENTIIVVWGDHGFKLGDYGEWAKHTNLELDTRVPLIFRLPNGKGAGKRSASMVELVDVLPTICEAAGVAIPDSAEGKSLLPLFEDPKINVRDFALSQYSRGRNVMGYSIRFPSWRYTEWIDRSNGAILERELYRLSGDDFLEIENLAEEFPEQADVFSKQLRERLDSAEKWEGSPHG